MGIGFPNPSSYKSKIRFSLLSLSDLLAANIVGFPVFLTKSQISLSETVISTEISTKIMITSLSSIANSICSSTCFRITDSGNNSNPPVSTKVK